MLNRVKRSPLAGFALTELCVTMVVLLVLSASAAGVYNEVTRQFQSRVSKDALLTALQIGRAQAIFRNGRVVVCKSPVSNGAARQCTVSGDWTQGWMVFHDRNSNAQRDWDEVVLHQEAEQPASVRIWNHASLRDSVSFTAFGRARTANNAMQMGSFFVCSRSEQRQTAFRLLVRSTGQARVVREDQPRC